MGQGGQFLLVNETPFDWVKTYEHSYQMNNWTLPAKIPAWTSQQVYVEFSGAIGDYTSDDAADTTYAFQGSGSTFKIGARGLPNFYLFVQFDSSQYSLGWNQDSTTSFALTGQPGSWIWANMNGSSWMQDNLSLLGTKTLREIAIPGAHDAGMSTNSSGGTAAANATNTIAQSLPIAGQLSMGTRFFDIRPVISNQEYLTGHYSMVENSLWQGQNGQSIQSIIQDINAFTAQQKELIILDLSHSLNTDVGDTSYRPFVQDEWDNLFSQLTSLNHRFSTITDDLTKLPLSDFIGSGSSAVVIIVEQTVDAPQISIDPKLGPGFYSSTRFSIVNQYSDTNDLATMQSDQLAKMASNNQNYFLLSWTLTQSNAQGAEPAVGAAAGAVLSIAAGPLGMLAAGAIGYLAGNVADSSILDLGMVANNALMAGLLVKQQDGFPNVILTDNIQDARSALTAMCLHFRQWFKPAAQFVPIGSYQFSSSNITVEIQAQCQPSAGTPVPSSLTYSASQQFDIGDIKNVNGVLTIVPPDGPVSTSSQGLGPYVPAGTYQVSSSNVTITLSAQCNNSQGQPVPSTLTYTANDAAASTDIANINGQLTLVKPS